MAFHMWFHNKFWQFKNYNSMSIWYTFQVHNITGQSLSPFRVMLLKHTTNPYLNKTSDILSLKLFLYNPKMTLSIVKSQQQIRNEYLFSL